MIHHLFCSSNIPQPVPPPIPLCSLCLALWEGSWWLCRNLGTPWWFPGLMRLSMYQSPSSLQGNETNAYSLEEKLWSSLNDQRTVDLVCTTVHSLNADAFDPTTWGLTQSLGRMFLSHCARIYSLSSANNFMIKTEIMKILISHN